MLPLPPARCVRLAGHAAAILDEAAGTRITCLEGCAWVTCYGDSRDLILQPGDSVVVDGPGSVVMTARREARLHIQRPGPASTGWHLSSLLRGLLRPRWHSAARRLAGGSVQEC